MTANTFQSLAPAKVNLTLHVTGRRADGYHELDTLVAFAPVCDRVLVQDANVSSLTVEGPEAWGVPADMDNLVMQAASLFPDDQNVSIVLEKHLPAASGIGGGSADAAATIRAMIARQDLDEQELEGFAARVLELGADVPMCLLSQSCRARGIGEQIDVVQIPPLPALLVNPRVQVATPDVFRALQTPDNAPMPEDLPKFREALVLINWLKTQRNDLETPAITVAPIIGQVLYALEATEGCHMARMSGSGATCFGLYADKDAAIAAERMIRQTHPEWWTSAGALGDLSRYAAATSA